MATSPPVEEAQPQKPKSGEPCPNCGSVEPWGTASWCPACGYYPALGGRSLRTAEEVEADADWDAQHQGPANLWEAIPAWGWVAVGGALVILLVNVALRMTVTKPSYKTLLTLIEISAGLITVGLAHGSAYLYACCKSDKFGPFDFIMRPIELWKPTIHKLPQGSKRVCGMAWGSAMLFCAVIIVGGFDLNALFEEDWGFEQPELEQPEHVVRVRRSRPSREDLKDAVNEILHEAVIEEEPVFLETQCVIIGYFKNDMDELNSLVLASAPRGRLAYVGLLSQGDIPEENRADLLKELKNLNELPSCYIKSGVPLTTAIWVEPKLLCLVEHTSWNTQYRLEQPRFLRIVSPEEEKKKKEKEERKKVLKKTRESLRNPSGKSR